MKQKDEPMVIVQDATDDYNYDYQNEVTLTRSNVLIESRYKAPILESKMLALSLTKLQHNYNKDFQVSFTMKELQDKMGLNANTYQYDRLKTLAKTIVQNYYFIEDPENNRFEAGALVTNAEYSDGIFTVTFNKKIKGHIWKLKNNFTPMKLSILMSFKNGKNNAAYRIYEVLRTQYYRITTTKPYVFKEYGLSEFMILIGMVDVNDDSVKLALERKANPDDIIKNIVKRKGESLYSWSDFNRRVLGPSVDEINSKTDIKVEYKPIKAGIGGKVVSVMFKIRKNEDYREDVSLDMQKEEYIPDAENLIELEKIIEEPISTKDKIAILKAAENDFDRIERAYRLLKKTKYVSNSVGWMIKALEEHWEANEPVPSYRGLNYDDVLELQQQAGDIVDDQTQEKTALYLIEKKITEDSGNQDELLSRWEHIMKNDKEKRQS